MPGDRDAAVARRYIVWVCCGCQDCEPLDGSAPSRFPCDNSPSSNGAEVVLAEDHDRLLAENAQLRAEIERLKQSSKRLSESLLRQPFLYER